MLKRPAQREFTFHGGRRPGAGRKRGNKVSHHPRPVFERAMPAHVTVRVRDDVPSLRSSRRFLAIKRSFAAARGLHGLRLVEFSVLSNHLHLVVEAESSVALAKGMQGLNVRVAKALNAMLGRRGGVFADHYHSHLLRTPTEVVRALQYVRTNAERHYGERGVDSCSSAAPGMDVLVVGAETWLLRSGWRRARIGRPRG
jgi:REP element-mobilizing transposase RayT